MNKLWLLLVVGLVTLPACGDSNSADPQQSPAPAEGEAADPLGDPSEFVEPMLQNFREGAEPPAGWPSDLIPLPQGAQPVAALDPSELPGGFEAVARFYAVEGSGSEIADFFQQALPEGGWSVVDRIDQGGYSEITAQTEDYLAVIGAGDVPDRPQLRSEQPIGLQIIVARLSA